MTVFAGKGKFGVDGYDAGEIGAPIRIPNSGAFAPIGEESILEEAQRITGNGGDRNDGYDHPRPNFTKIAGKWSITLGVPITAEQVAIMMIDLKTVRESHKHSRDNLVDIAGYARCIERLGERDE